MNMVMKVSLSWNSDVWSAARPLPPGSCHLRTNIVHFCGCTTPSPLTPPQTNPPIHLLAAIRRLLRLKWHICGALNGTFVALSLTQFESQPNFHMYIYIYVQYTYYQWVKHGLILLKTESCYFSLT